MKESPGLSSQQRKKLRQAAHHLDPVVIIGEHGLTPGVLEETERALTDHELIKIRINADRDARVQISAAIAAETNAEVVQKIGKVIVVYRFNKKASTKLSNVARLLGDL